MAITPGELDRRVKLLRFGVVNDAYGDPREGSSPLATVWAAKRAAPGRERLVSGQSAADAPTVFVIRWSPTVADLNPKDRVEYPVGSGRTFDIKSVVEIGRHEGLEIAAVGRAD